MISGDTQQPLKNIIPPTHQSVKAGFVIYSPGSENRNIIILEEGELVARETTPPYATVFTMRPGDLVGVAALLEREPFKYELSASKDSRITVVTEECMESELKTLPLWLLALLRNMSAKTHQLKRSSIETRVKDTLKSLAEYLSHKKENTEYNLADLIREFCFLTKISTVAAQEDFKTILRRHLLKLSKKNDRIYCKVIERKRLSILVDYLNANDDFAPYKLSSDQRKIVAFLADIDPNISKNATDWITLFKEKITDIDVSQWINLLKLGWLNRTDEEKDLYVVCTDKVKYFQTALKYETNIRGVM